MSKGRLFVLCAGVALVALFLSLGIWQLERRTWKLALIAQVEAQLAQAPSPAPGPDAWDQLTAYQTLRLHGEWIQGRDTLVLAVTKLGRGYWVMTPLKTDEGFSVLVNRGFVPDTMARDASIRELPTGSVTIEGLLRPSEPPRGFLRANDPANDRWYSRNTDAIAEARGIDTVAPYFVDANAARAASYPRGGLTVIRFRNDHLQYALTWFAMGIGLAATLGYLGYRAIRQRKEA